MTIHHPCLDIFIHRNRSRGERSETPIHFANIHTELIHIGSPIVAQQGSIASAISSRNGYHLQAGFYCRISYVHHHGGRIHTFWSCWRKGPQSETHDPGGTLVYHPDHVCSLSRLQDGHPAMLLKRLTETSWRALKTTSLTNTAATVQRDPSHFNFGTKRWTDWKEQAFARWTQQQQPKSYTVILEELLVDSHKQIKPGSFSTCPKKSHHGSKHSSNCQA